MRTLLSILFILGALEGWAQSTKTTEKLLVFSVNGKPVYADEFNYQFKKNNTKPEDATEKKVEEYLGLLVNFKLKVEEARAQGLDTTEAFRKEFDSYRSELKKPYVAGKDVLDQLTREAYQRLTEEVRASHILITCPPDATPADTLKAFNKAISFRQQIYAGNPFGKMARDFSDDPSAKSNDGDLGYFTVLQMVYPFEQAAYRLKIGEISTPVRTRFGYHLIQVTDRKPARGEVEVSHILLRAGTDQAKVKNKIFEIYDQLQAGRSWDELCKTYSEEAATKNAGGRLRTFGVGAVAGVPEFELVAFSLKEPGEISDPFQSAYGWHIIRLEKKVPVPPYGEVESSLRRRVSRDDRLQVGMQGLLESDKKRLGYVEDAAVLNQVYASMDTTLTTAKWRYKGDPGILGKTLFTLDQRAYKAGAFVSFLQRHQKQNNIRPVDYAARQFDVFLQEKIDEVDDHKLMASEPAYKNLVTEYREGILLFTIMEKEVWNKASSDSIGQRQFYERNKMKYQAGERVRARVFSSTDKKFLEEVRNRTASGDSIRRDEMKKFKSVQPVRNYERKEHPAVDGVPWVMGLHEAEVGGNYYLVEIESLLPAGQKEFEEARSQVISDYQDSLDKEWVQRLREKYPVKVNTKGRKYVINELTRK